MKLIIDTIINALQSLTIEQFKFNSHITCKMQAIMRPNDKYIICLKQYYISNSILRGLIDHVNFLTPSLIPANKNYECSMK